MATCRVLEQADGSLAIIHPAPKARRLVALPDGTTRPETDDEFHARVFAATVAKALALAGRPFVDLSTTALPADLSQRKRWRLQGGAVVVDPTVPLDPRPVTQDDLLQWVVDRLNEERAARAAAAVELADARREVEQVALRKAR